MAAAAGRALAGAHAEPDPAKDDGADDDESDGGPEHLGAAAGVADSPACALGPRRALACLEVSFGVVGVVAKDRPRPRRRQRGGLFGRRGGGHVMDGGRVRLVDGGDRRRRLPSGRWRGDAAGRGGARLEGRAGPRRRRRSAGRRGAAARRRLRPRLLAAIGKGNVGERLADFAALASARRSIVIAIAAAAAAEDGSRPARYAVRRHGCARRRARHGGRTRARAREDASGRRSLRSGRVRVVARSSRCSSATGVRQGIEARRGASAGRGADKGLGRMQQGTTRHVAHTDRSARASLSSRRHARAPARPRGADFGPSIWGAGPSFVGRMAGLRAG